MSNYEYPEINDVEVTDEYLLLDKIEVKKETDFGFKLPFNTSNFINGIVLKVGPGKKIDEMVISPWSEVIDIVIYEDTKSKKITINRKTFYLVKESEGVLAKTGDLINGEIKIYDEF